MKKYSPGLNYKELNEKFPHTMRSVKEWFMNRPDVTEVIEFKQQNDKARIINGYVDTMVGFNARGLYEFFDEQNIKIYITDHPEFSETFFYYNSETRNSKTANSRIEAEESAFIDAFEAFEKRN